MAKIDIKSESEASHMDPTPSIREIAQAIKQGTVTIVPNIHAADGYPIVWVSLKDLATLRRALGEKKEPSGAI
jgi:hypothetical protein